MTAPTPEEMAFFQQMRSFVASMQGGGLSGTIATPGPSSGPAAAASNALPAEPLPTSSSSQSAGPAPIGPYQSARLPMAPQGFPSSLVNISSNGPSSSTPPFLGFNQLGGISNASRVNHQRLSSAQATLPRAPSLQTRQSRRRPRGPAIHPPSLPTVRKPSIGNTCLTELFNSDGSTTQGVKVIAKVYPPQVCDLLTIAFALILTMLFRSTNLIIFFCIDSRESLLPRP